MASLEVWQEVTARVLSKTRLSLERLPAVLALLPPPLPVGDLVLPGVLRVHEGGAALPALVRSL